MKSIITVALLFSSSSLLMAQARDTTAPKQYTVSLTLNQWLAVQQIIDASTASHVDVQAVKGWIFSPILKQQEAEKPKALPKKP